MRIAFISYEYPPDSANGGIATYIYQASRMLAERGHQVEVFASTPNEPRTEIREGVIEHWISEPCRTNFAVPAGHQFANRHRENPFHVLEGPEYNADARIARQLVSDVGFVVKMHTPTLLIEKLNRPFSLNGLARLYIKNVREVAKAIIRRTLPNPWQWHEFSAAVETDRMERKHALEADIVACPCLALCQYATNTWYIPASKVRHAPLPYNPSSQLSDIPPSETPDTVGFIGRLETRKGIETFAAAIPRVLSCFPNTKFKLVGSPCLRTRSNENYEIWLRRKLKRYEDAVDFVGKVPLPEMAAAYKSLGICVFPSLWENFPNVCLEAMSASRAIIASREGGMADMLSPPDSSECGVLIPPNSPDLLSRAIVRLLNSRDLRVKLGTNARNRIAAAYNPQKIGELTEALYQEAYNIRMSKLRK